MVKSSTSSPAAKRSSSKKESRSRSTWITMIIAVLAVFIAYLMVSDRTSSSKAGNLSRKAQLLLPISLPSSEKLARVKKDEKLRADLVASGKIAGYNEFGYNAWLSDRLPLNRRSWDSRHKSCLKKKYVRPAFQPSASIVVAFYNEAMSTLLRAVTTAYERSPADLVHEIIVIDAGSTNSELGSDLDAKLKSMDKVRLIRLNSDYEGQLVSANDIGARQAEGEVIVFLSSRSECGDGWLEPLIDIVRRNPRTVAIPALDVVTDNEWEWRTGNVAKIGSNWNLEAAFVNVDPGTLANRKKTDPVLSGGMSATIFAMNSTFFTKLGGFDTGMVYSGGDEIEMSLRATLCGATLDIVPCSRVAVVNQLNKPSAQYKDIAAEDAIAYNRNRVAEVFLGRHKAAYYHSTKSQSVGYGNIADRRSKFEQMGCKPFSWYMDKVFPEIGKPPVQINTVDEGEVAGDDEDPFGTDHVESKASEPVDTIEQNMGESRDPFDDSDSTNFSEDPFEDGPATIDSEDPFAESPESNGNRDPQTDTAVEDPFEDDDERSIHVDESLDYSKDPFAESTGSNDDNTKSDPFVDGHKAEDPFA